MDSESHPTTSGVPTTERREGLRVETPPGPRIRTLFGEERATPAVLDFLRDTKVGKFVSLAALGGDARAEEAEPAWEESERLIPCPAGVTV